MSNPVIFETIHGSYLYGLANTDSDMDFYRVYEGDGVNLRQSMSGAVDTVRGDLRAFITRAESGSHQSLEALFSPFKLWGDGMEQKWGSYLANLRITGSDVFAKYERTIKKFCYGDFKRRRHAIRLRYNLDDLREFGRFNPRLTTEQINWADKYASLEGDELKEMLLS